MCGLLILVSRFIQSKVLRKSSDSIVMENITQDQTPTLDQNCEKKCLPREMLYHEQFPEYYMTNN